MTDVSDFPSADQDALEIWADITFGDHTVHPELDCTYLTKKPAQCVVAGDAHESGMYVWVHEAFAEMAVHGTRGVFERDPGPDEFPNKSQRRAFRDLKATERVSYIDASLHLHFAEHVKVDVFEILGNLMGCSPDSIYDRELDSGFEGYDQNIYFTLSRAGDNEDPMHPEAWAVPRFKRETGSRPSDLLYKLADLDSSAVKVITLATPLQ